LRNIKALKIKIMDYKIFLKPIAMEMINKIEISLQALGSIND
jgi:hypothetical protein